MLNKDMTIFLVDDDPFHLEILKQLLENEGLHNITCFSSGVACLENIHKTPDLVFLDHQMNVYSGHQTLKKIKRYDPNIHVVMISAQEDIETAVETLKHGAFDYIQKGDNLKEKVQDVLAKIEDVKTLLAQEKPSLLQKLFKFI